MAKKILIIWLVVAAVTSSVVAGDGDAGNEVPGSSNNGQKETDRREQTGGAYGEGQKHGGIVIDVRFGEGDVGPSEQVVAGNDHVVAGSDHVVAGGGRGRGGFGGHGR